MIKTPINLQDLRKRIYYKAKREKYHKFWGLYVHIIKYDTIVEAYQKVRKKNGSSGIDNISFDDIENYGVSKYLQEIQQELATEIYYPKTNRLVEIPKNNGETRMLGIPIIKNRIVQMALRLIIEPIFETDFQDGSYGYRPKRISDSKIMRLIKLILKSGGKLGLPQGGVISPLFSNIYLNDFDKMLEKGIMATLGKGKYTNLSYTRFADDIVIMVKGHKSLNWLTSYLIKRIKEEIEKLKLTLNKEKSKYIDLTKGKSFGFLGFQFKSRKITNKKRSVSITPLQENRNKIILKIKEIIKRHYGNGIFQVMINEINIVLRGWVNYFRIGHSNGCFSYVRTWTEKKVRKFLTRRSGRKG